MKPVTATITKETTAIAFTETYATGYCIPLWVRDEQIKLACKRVTGRIQPYEGTRTEPIAIVGYGPSLQQTWEQLTEFQYIISTSGAHRFLLDRGIVPTWHVEVDPRSHKIAMLGAVHPDVTYCICSTCHPNYFRALLDAKANIQLWHSFTTEAEGLRVLPPGEYALTGGCDVGMRAMAVARFFGFTTQHVFGMDGCSQQETAHAGVHTNPMKKFYDLEYPLGSGTIYRTTPALMQVAKTVPHEVAQLKLETVTFHGEGLVQAIMREEPATPVKMSNLAFVKPVLVSDAYRALNQQLHETEPAYGTSGQQHVETVLKLVERLKPASVLDYGCGKGTLARGLPFPIWEYDPAIPGKEMEPRAAELVICTDVLEHVEPDKLHDVLGNLQALVLKVGYFVIATRAAKKTLPDGRNAHLIQRAADWWEKKLGKYFDIGKVQDLGGAVQVVVGPKTPEHKKDLTTITHDGTSATFYTPNDTTLWRAKTLMTKEPITIQWIDTMQAGEVLWDIGANVGGYSIWASKRRGVEVYAFEPEAANYAILCRNFRENAVTGLAYNLALAEQPKLDVLYCSQPLPGGSCHSFGQNVGPDLTARQGVKQGAISMTLDQLTSLLPRPTHLKIDVDGFEHLVLAGGKALFQSDTLTSLLIEVNESLPAHQAMLADLTAYGYTYEQAQVDAARRTDGPFKGCAEYLFTKVSATERAVLDAIERAPIIPTPFPHCLVEQVFPPDVYTALLAGLPTQDEYQTLEASRGTKGYPQRYTHAAPPSLAWMTQGRLRRLLDRKFGVTSAQDETVLLRDFEGYTIPPHTDTPSKVVTMLTFLGESRHGTALYIPNEPGFTDPEGRHHPLAQFTETYQVSGAPNTALLFARTDTSFHGTAPFPGPGPRDILLYDTRRPC